MWIHYQNEDADFRNWSKRMTDRTCFAAAAATIRVDELLILPLLLLLLIDPLLLLLLLMLKGLIRNLVACCWSGTELCRRSGLSVSLLLQSVSTDRTPQFHCWCWCSCCCCWMIHCCCCSCCWSRTELWADTELNYVVNGTMPSIRISSIAMVCFKLLPMNFLVWVVFVPDLFQS